MALACQDARGTDMQSAGFTVRLEPLIRHMCPVEARGMTRVGRMFGKDLVGMIGSCVLHVAREWECSVI